MKVNSHINTYVPIVPIRHKHYIWQVNGMINGLIADRGGRTSQCKPQQ